MTVPLRYSATAEAAWRDCPRKWWWSQYHGFRPVETPDALATGIAWHQLLEEYWVGGALADAIAIETSRQAKLAAMMAGYRAAYPLADRPRVLAIEQRFDLPLCDWRDGEFTPLAGWSMVGGIDCLVEIAGEVWVVESKTCSEDISPGADYWQRLRLDPQISTYWMAAQSLGYDVAGVLYDVARKPDLRPYSATLAASRKYTKDGKLYAAQHEHDETPTEFSARCLTAIETEPVKFFRREPVRRLISQVQQHCRSMAAFARQMEVAIADDYTPQNPASCNRFGQCQFWQVCCAGPQASPADVPGAYTTREERGSHSEASIEQPATLPTVMDSDPNEERWW